MSPWWVRLVRYSHPSWARVALVAALMLVHVGLTVLQPWPMKLLVDYVLRGEELPERVVWIAALPGGDAATVLVGWLVGVVVALFLVGQGVKIVQGYVEAGVGARMKYRLGARLLDHLQRLSVRFHGRHPIGDLVKRVVQDTGCARDLVLGVFMPLVAALLSLLSMFLVMWVLDRTLTLLALLVAPLIAALIKLFDRPMTERTYEHQQVEGQMMALAEQTLSALPVVQAFGRESREDGRFRDLSRKALSAYLRSILSQLEFKVGVGAATAVGTAAIMYVGGLHVLQGILSVGDLLVFLSYLAALYSPLQSLAYLSLGFASAAAGARRTLEVLDADQEVWDRPGARPLPSRPPGERGHVQMEAVTFGYEPGHPVLSDVTLEARPGEVVALVGPTGAGKSTLVSLIPRFFDPWSGRVVLDGMDVRDIQLSHLRAQISVLFQEPFLLPVSVADNIAYGRPGASREDVIAAAAAANADEFIRRLPQGYETLIGERGSTLSGGEKQRLAVARALLKDASVFIFDEPTSALDAETEAQLLQALERLMRARTTFIIAHRLSTVERANRILVLEDGRVVETGTHEELLSANGAYQRLYRMQFSAQPVASGA